MRYIEDISYTCITYLRYRGLLFEQIFALALKMGKQQCNFEELIKWVCSFDHG